LFTFAINLPFGAWRQRTKRFTIPWFLAIHLPIPFIVLFRIYLGFSYILIPVLVLAALGGQIIGGKIKR